VKGFVLRQFNPPPGWPEPPNVRWRPPKNFRPRSSWPAPPAGWAFWVDEDGNPVRGPIGRFGGPPVLKLGALVAAVLTLVGLLLVVPFGGQDSATTVPPNPTATAPESTTPSSGTTARLPVGKPFGSSPDGVTESPTRKPTDEPTRRNPRTESPVTDWFPSPQPSATPAAPTPPWSEPTQPSSGPPSSPQPSPSPTESSPTQPSPTDPSPTPEPTTPEPTTPEPSSPEPTPSPTQPTTVEPSPVTPTPAADPSPSPTG